MTSKKLNKIIWEPIFSREGFSYFIASLAFEGYAQDMVKKIGWGYRDQLVISKDNFLTVYGSLRDQKSFTKFAAKHNEKFFIKVNNLIITKLKKAEKNISELNKLLAIPDLSADEIKKILTIFYISYRDLYSVYRFSTLFDGYYNGKFKKKLVKKFAKTKDLCGRFFTETDKTTLEIIKKHLSIIMKVDKKILLGLSYQEIIRSINQKKLVISKGELKFRSNNFTLLAVDHKLKLIVKNQTKFSKNNFIFAGIKDNANEIKGQVACRGKVTGIVKVALLASQLKRAKIGSILVTPMTTFNHVSFLRKFSAIITDEGGVTCHAAIISRELNKPCIIGTKIATKVLRDGDFIEVDANNGVVKILR